MFSDTGIKIWTFGIGPEGKKVSMELGYLASSPRYSINGDITGMIQKSTFTVVSGGLLKSEFILFANCLRK